ncbi:UNVERIFIED_CONTAM: Retrovirus-related Pol polyprotein from transposon TNT 1-94 [Sesamum latifolium]|uniref:Retrovirus-related Pol polyprotein from transposon TNT 1-94 n=1 Tax=Sesamum latifolium TaxID=2727402 RepID=A0AAW2XBR0_9LAMI
MESFSPVAKAVTVCIFLEIVASYVWPIQQLDINDAFLHGYMDEDLYMDPPEGYVVEPDLVCKLERSLYGLKQASQQWNLEFTQNLEAYGFVQLPNDHCLFTMGSDTGKLFLLVYVYHILIGTSLSEIESVKTKYTLDIIKDTGILQSKAVSTPFPQGLKLTTNCGAQLQHPDAYQRLVGRLLYLGFTRSDTRCSLTGFCIFLGDALISRKTKKQSTASRSTAEAEYRSLEATICELRWITLNNIEIDCHIVRDAYKDGFVHPSHIKGADQLADIFTKPLPLKSFSIMVSKLGLVSFLPSSTCGGLLNIQELLQSFLRKKTTPLFLLIFNSIA